MRSLVFAVLVTFAASARADGFYASETIGGATVGDELHAYTASTEHVSLGLGWRSRQWAVQLDFGGDIAAQPEYAPSEPAGGTYQPSPGLTSVGVTVKRLVRVSPHVDAYVRGRMMRGYADGELATFAGNGLGAGVGFQLKGHLTLLGSSIALAVFVDSGYDFYRLHDQSGVRPVAIDATFASMSLGWAVGKDF